MNSMLNVATTAVRSAAKIILTGLDRIDSIRITEKSRNDFVTSVDKAAESEIIATLSQAYPDHHFLSEESFSETELNTKDNFWIIDPLDGTTNFIHRIPHFAISVAFYHKGQVEMALVYDPVKDEIFTALRGKGARCNQHRIRVSQCKHLDRALLAMTGFTMRSERSEECLKILNNAYGSVGAVRRSGSSALDLAYVAAGRYDGLLDIGLKPWDVAAGNMLVKESGGYVCDLQGKHDLLATDVIAANPSLCAEIQKLLLKA